MAFMAKYYGRCYSAATIRHIAQASPPDRQV